MATGKSKEIPGGVELNGWAITTANRPILTSWELDEYNLFKFYYYHIKLKFLLIFS